MNFIVYSNLAKDLNKVQKTANVDTKFLGSSIGAVVVKNKNFTNDLKTKSIGNGESLHIKGDAYTAASEKDISKNNYTVKIKHKNGYYSVYSNINLFKKFKVNQKIYQGEAFAYTFSAWSMDESEYGSIFKFKLQKNNKYINPIPYLKSFKYKIFVPNNY